MAGPRFNFSTPANNTIAGATGQQREKAAAFINFAIPVEGGGQAKIGAIPLYAHNADDAKLLAWLKSNTKIEVKDADSGEVATLAPIEFLAQSLVVDFREVRTEAHKFALPGM